MTTHLRQGSVEREAFDARRRSGREKGGAEGVERSEEELVGEEMGGGVVDEGEGSSGRWDGIERTKSIGEGSGETSDP